MRMLTLKEIEETYGAFLPAIAAFIMILTVPQVIHNTNKVCNEFGHNLGEWGWETFHPYDPNW